MRTVPGRNQEQKKLEVDSMSGEYKDQISKQEFRTPRDTPNPAYAPLSHYSLIQNCPDPNY
jgi:hypothetical protein